MLTPEEIKDIKATFDDHIRRLNKEGETDYHYD